MGWTGKFITSGMTDWSPWVPDILLSHHRQLALDGITKSLYAEMKDCGRSKTSHKVFFVLLWMFAFHHPLIYSWLARNVAGFINKHHRGNISRSITTPMCTTRLKHGHCRQWLTHILSWGQHTSHLKKRSLPFIRAFIRLFSVDASRSKV